MATRVAPSARTAARVSRNRTGRVIPSSSAARTASAHSRRAAVTALQGQWCLDSGISPHTGAACATPGFWNPNGGPRGLVRDTRNFIAASQTDLTARFDTGAIAHTLVAGVSLNLENFELDTGSLFNDADLSLIHI